jgi:hypothetical protein
VKVGYRQAFIPQSPSISRLRGFCFFLASKNQRAFSFIPHKPSQASRSESFKHTAIPQKSALPHSSELPHAIFPEENGKAPVGKH